MKNLRLTLGAVAATTVLGIAALPGVASAQTTTTSDARPRLEKACARIPNLQLRTDNLLKRIEGDASTVGSLAWLDGEIAKAQAAGRTQVVVVLQNRKGVRTALIPVLEQRKTQLVNLAQKCDELKAQG